MATTLRVMKALLAEHIAQHNLCPGSSTVESWLGAHWLRVRVSKWTVPLIPLWGLKRAHIAHDVHHVLTGYPTTVKGECELASWELASGGCRWNLFFWIDRLAVFALGLVCYPRATLKALRRGWGCHNLYGVRPAEILGGGCREVRLRTGL